ncbi:MAG: hypothetical protein RSE13_00010 [Planktothrix sp. GU0601_MAG3]|nr:MAG: hypothetical protein RSE13_00010 [Planktothrix sp. GU0601_MAG3]
MPNKDAKLAKLWAMDIKELKKLDRNQINALAKNLGLTPHDIFETLEMAQFYEDLEEMVNNEYFFLEMYPPHGDGD